MIYHQPSDRVKGNFMEKLFFRISGKGGVILLKESVGRSQGLWEAGRLFGPGPLALLTRGLQGGPGGSEAAERGSRWARKPELEATNAPLSPPFAASRSSTYCLYQVSSSPILALVQHVLSNSLLHSKLPGYRSSRIIT